MHRVRILPADTTALEQANQVTSVFIIADRASGGYQVSFLWQHAGVEADVIVEEPAHIFDIDQDGIPELITRTEYYESFDYAVYRRVGKSWKLRYRGGG